MADIKMSQFQSATEVKDADLIPIVQDGINKKVSSPILESKIIKKTAERLLAQGGISMNLINPIDTVSTYSDLASITPTPNINNAYQVESDGLVYVYTENGFQTEGNGFKVQPNVDGVVEQENTNAVSGGEVFKSIDGVIDIKEIDIDTSATFSLTASYAQNSGNITDSLNWISAIINFDRNEYDKIYIEGGDFNNTSNVKLVFYNSNTTNSTTMISSITDADTSPKTYDVPLGTVKMYVLLNSGANVGADLPNSIYNTKFKPKYVKSVLKNVLNIESITYDSDIKTKQVDYIEKNLLLKGNGSPSVGLGIEGNLYLDLNNNTYFIKENDIWNRLNKDNINFKEFYYPKEFLFRPKNILSENGKYTFENFSNIKDEFVQSDIDRLTNYYVDPINGNNTNNGLTRLTALKTIQYAVMTKGARVIRLLKGNQSYGRTSTFDITSDIATNEPLIMIGEEDGVFLSQSDKASAYTWTLVDNVWSAPRNSVANVFDFNQTTLEGNPKALKKAINLNDCKNTINSFFSDASIVYVNTSDGLAPTSKFELVLEILQQYVPSENIPYVYFENITFANSAGGNILIKNNTTTQFNTKVYIYKCKGISNHNTNNFSIDNVKECWVQDCEAYDAKNDGFNYHTSKLSSGYTPMKVVEINCKGSRFGENYPAETSSNASTVHEGISIIRMNSNFEFGRGGLIADVDENTKSLNLNVTSNYNYASNGSSFLIQGVNTNMWLFDCTAINLVETQTAFLASGSNSIGKYKNLTTYSSLSNVTSLI